MEKQTTEVQDTMTWADVRAMSENGVPIPLTSVPDARLRHVAPFHLIRRHKEMPALLTAFVLKTYSHGIAQEDYDALFAPRESPEEALEMLAALEIVCKQGFAYPKIVDEVQGEGEITIDDITVFDQMLAMRLMFLPRHVLFNINLYAEQEATVDIPVAEAEATE
jgi:hypothetical protein